MTYQTATFDSRSADETARLAVMLAAHLVPGDTILLSGEVGAGKTHFARHLIQSVLVEPEDVPSPTFTLVQVYDTRNGPLWHLDLYRISSASEIEELGVSEAFETAICLVEWPDRLGDRAPETALSLSMTQAVEDEHRHVKATWTSSRWTTRLSEWAAP